VDGDIRSRSHPYLMADPCVRQAAEIQARKHGALYPRLLERRFVRQWTAGRWLYRAEFPSTTGRAGPRHRLIASEGRCPSRVDGTAGRAAVPAISSIRAAQEYARSSQRSCAEHHEVQGIGVLLLLTTQRL
jgi:hypothetical protein